MSSTHHFKHCMKGTIYTWTSIGQISQLVNIGSTTKNVVGASGNYKITIRTYNPIGVQWPIDWQQSFIRQ